MNKDIEEALSHHFTDDLITHLIERLKESNAYECNTIAFEELSYEIRKQKALHDFNGGC